MTKIDYKKFYFSYSSLNTFETCKYQFKLSYLDKVPRVGNFFSDFGSFCHDVLEKYFSGELEIYELMDYYEKEFINNVKTSPPPFLKVWQPYYDSGLAFFENFDFDRSEYDIINVEEYIKGTDREMNLVIKPDLILTKKDTSDIIILDFKTSEIIDKKGKLDEEKLQGYKKQINLYIYYIWFFKGIEINKARLWFIRSNSFYEWDYNQDDVTDVINWAQEVSAKIKVEEDWAYNNKNKFMCNVLCSVRESCKFRKE